MPEKPWYKSKTKIGGLILGLGQLLKVVPIPEVQQYASLADALGAALTAFGVRDALDK